MASPDPERTLDDLLDGHRFAMVTTSTTHGLSARPLTLLEQEDGVLRFLVSTESEWVQQLGGPGTPIQVSFAKPDDNTFVALSGDAALDRDRAAVERLYNPAAGVYFDGEDDPSAAVLEVTVRDGEWWDGPGTKVGMALQLAKRAITGNDQGAHGTVDPT